MALLVQLFRRCIGFKHHSIKARELLKESFSPEAKTVEVFVADGGKRLKVLAGSRKESLFHSLWLRHSCQCSDCARGVRRMVHWSELPSDLRIASASVEGVDLQIIAFVVFLSNSIRYPTAKKRKAGIKGAKKNTIQKFIYEGALL